MGVGLEDGALAGGVLDGGVLEEGVLAGGVLDGFALEAGVLAAGGGDDRGFAILTSISTRGDWLDAGELMGFKLEAGMLEDAAGVLDIGELLAGELDAGALRLIVVFLNGGVGDMRILLLLAGVVMGCELLIGVGVSLTDMLELRKGVVELALGIALEATFAFCKMGAVPEDMAELAGAGAVELAKGGVLDGIRADEPPVDIGIAGLAFRAGVDMGDVEFMEAIEEDFLADNGIGMDELELLAEVDIGVVEFIELMGAMEEDLAEEAPVDIGMEAGVDMPPEDAAALVEFANGGVLEGCRDEEPGMEKAPVDMGIDADDLELAENFGMAMVEFADEAILDEAPVDRGRDIIVETGVFMVEFENGAELMGGFTEDVTFLGGAAAVLIDAGGVPPPPRMLDLDIGAVALADDLDDAPWDMAPVESGGVMVAEDGLPAVEFMYGAELIFGGAEAPG
ncbi:hypothetical protein K4F52_006531 [Lecanicillium sp. MT-2017a]|nr:hypothetical protein K4F52_006531 [Lecanicillium sp. MT-2017a]